MMVECASFIINLETTMQKLSRVANNIRTDVAVSKPIAPSTLGISLFHIMRRFPFASNMSFPFLWNQLSFRARPCDYWALEEVLLNREYEFLSPILMKMGKSPVIVDAGANIGTFSLFILSICPDAFLYAIEPSTQAFHILERNAALAKRPNWSVFQAALWKEDGSISFENMETSVASRIAGLTGSETTGSVESVPALRLDSFIAKHIRKPIDLLKLDIEGAEEAVLDANDSVLDETQHLLIEIHPTQADEAKITSLIHKHFPYVRRIQDRDNKELSLVFASHTIPSL